MQIWNVNRHNGMVGVFNLQGSSWSRTRRQFVIHDATPPSLTTAVKPADIPLLSSSSSLPDQAALDGSAAGHENDNNGVGAGQQEFVAFCNATQQLVRLGWHEGIDVALAGMELLLKSCSSTAKGGLMHQHTWSRTHRIEVTNCLFSVEHTALQNVC